VSFGSAYQGVWVSRSSCDTQGTCEPGTWQVATGSNFIAALNRGDPTPARTAYTSIYSDTDEFTRTGLDRFTSARDATRLEGARQIGIQEVCPGRPVEHLQESEDAATFAIVVDALDHTGPASIRRISPLACAAATPAGFDLARRAAALAAPASNGERPLTDHEPPLRCYADPKCA
jgi:triacylglycerol lipase